MTTLFAHTADGKEQVEVSGNLPQGVYGDEWHSLDELYAYRLSLSVLAANAINVAFDRTVAYWCDHEYDGSPMSEWSDGSYAMLIIEPKPELRIGFHYLRKDLESAGLPYKKCASEWRESEMTDHQKMAEINNLLIK